MGKPIRGIFFSLTLRALASFHPREHLFLVALVCITLIGRLVVVVVFVIFVAIAAAVQLTFVLLLKVVLLLLLLLVLIVAVELVSVIHISGQLSRYIATSAADSDWTMLNWIDTAGDSGGSG